MYNTAAQLRKQHLSTTPLWSIHADLFKTACGQSYSYNQTPFMPVIRKEGKDCRKGLLEKDKS